MPSQYELLGAARITGAMQGLQDPRLLPQQLLWSRRIPDTPSLDEEILARFQGQIQIADLLADDAKALVYSQGRFQLETVKIPNLKLGIAMNQAQINQFQRLAANFAGPMDLVSFNNWQNSAINNLLIGVNQRKEALFIAMLIDALNYDRMGFKLSNVTWGMPADLKVTPSAGWDDPVNGKPITDINTIRRIASARYGVVYNRVTMSTSAFQYMVATAEFQAQAKIFGWGLVNVVPQIPLQNDAAMMELARRIFGNLTIELYDARYWQQDVNGLIASYPFMPINKVILTDTGNDNNANAMDFANGIVTESVVASAMPVNIAGRIPVGYGPIGYSTAPPDLNPPNITMWGVARGFPRKKLLQASAVLTVGTFTDTIAVGVPFPA